MNYFDGKIMEHIIFTQDEFVINPNWNQILSIGDERLERAYLWDYNKYRHMWE